MTQRLTKQFIIDYLLSHFRYHTMNSWNRSHSYAARVKIYDFVPNEIRDTAYKLLETHDPYDDIDQLLREFSLKYNYAYQVGFNGRSSGYLVLYTGGKKDGRVYSQPGCSIDGDEFGAGGDKFKEYSFVQLKERYRLVKDFDALVESCKEVFLDYCRNFTVEEKTIKVDKVVKVLKPIEEEV